MGLIHSITAAASRIITSKKGGSSGAGKNSYASMAWDFYDIVPEVGAYADWCGNAMSGARLFAGKMGPDGEIVPGGDTERASQLVAAIAGGPAGQSGFLGDSGTQLAVAGDQWVVIIPDKNSDDMSKDRWLVLSTEEVTVQKGKIKALVDGDEMIIPEYDPNAEARPDEPAYFRIWKPSPRRHQQATSPVLRSLVILEELRLLNAAVAAIARSRITGRGILLVPAGTRFPVQPGQDQAEDGLLDTFIEVASTAIREPESAAATVPIVLELPGDLIGDVKWIQFTSEFDSMAIQLRDEAIRRFAAGADVPAEILLGLGDASHWGAWAITAEALRMGAEPKLAIVCQGLTTEWLRPILEAEGVADADEWQVWYDTSALRSSSNKSAVALEARKEGLISDAAARRELGFTEADAPGAEDEEVPVPATTEGNDLPVNETQAPPTEPGIRIAAALAATEREASQSAVLDSFTAGTDAALAEAVDGLVWTALTLAGRKMLLTPIVPRPDRGQARRLIADARIHQTFQVRSQEQVEGYKLLEDAWTRVPTVATRYGLDPTTLTAALDGYVTALLVTGATHEFDNVPRLLAQMRVADVPLDRGEVA
jgi:hypothetical protein